MFMRFVKRDVIDKAIVKIDKVAEASVKRVFTEA